VLPILHAKLGVKNNKMKKKKERKKEDFEGSCKLFMATKIGPIKTGKIQ